MPEHFLQLPDKDRKAILTAAAQKVGISAKALEKDVWVCWTLEKLIAMPDVPPLAFKGGTSLSKAFNAIARFSEDVDVTLDRQSLAPDLDPFVAAKKSKTQARKTCDKLDEILADYIVSTIKPYFDSCLQNEIQDTSAETKIGGSPDNLYIPYPTCVAGSSSYLQERVLLELGGKNKITPSKSIQLQPYIQSEQPSLVLPVPKVDVLASERTFWEKATLIHAECHREKTKANAERLSRHWYDLYQLSQSQIGSSALADLDLLDDVVKQKTVLYPSGWANYDACLGGIRLAPNEATAKALGEDFEQMKASGMFWEDPPSFSEILEELSELESTINKLFS